MECTEKLFTRPENRMLHMLKMPVEYISWYLINFRNKIFTENMKIY